MPTNEQILADRLSRRISVRSSLGNPAHHRDQEAVCPDRGCAAPWVDGTMQHVEDCQYLVMVDSIDAQQE